MPCCFRIGANGHLFQPQPSKKFVRRLRNAAYGRNQKRTGNDKHCQKVDPNRATLLRSFPEGDQDFSPGQGEASLGELRRRPGYRVRPNIGRAERFPLVQNIAEADTNDGYVY
jgi:hypothetical protein